MSENFATPVRPHGWNPRFENNERADGRGVGATGTQGMPGPSVRARQVSQHWRHNRLPMLSLDRVDSP
jgi:hypothetical protein